ncbi:MAG: hypothetical protein LLF83_02520 [Methanobacterium sp.]|nr:hypothetical protein [Methanobacterium sp.]
MNRVIIIAVVLAIVFLSGCIQSDVSSINDMTISINNHLKKGDEYYNQSATNTNKLSLNQALTDANNANTEYTSAQTSAQTALNSAKNANDGIYIDYIQNALFEVQAKLNATSELKTAITLLENNETSSANEHLSLANDFMDKAIQYKKNREEIVKQNPNKFK